MKQKTYKEKDTERTRGRKRYLERVQETEEAEEEIKEYTHQLEFDFDIPENVHIKGE